jgi:hypothetical protein
MSLWGRWIVPVSFVAYIDESGDTGLESVKPINERGASEWLVLSCFLVRAVNDAKLPEWVRGIQAKFKNVQSPHLHFSDLLPFKRLMHVKRLRRIHAAHSSLCRIKRTFSDIEIRISTRTTRRGFIGG